MTQPTTPDSLPPLLKRFHDYLPGDIHSIAAKAHLIDGFEACKGNSLANAVWNDDKTALVVTFIGGSQTTLLVEGVRLLTKCSCKQWQPARNCPHVVVAWATLKRVVSPGTLSHIRFNQQMLQDMKRFTDQEPASGNDAVSDTVPDKKPVLTSLVEDRRLLNEEINKLKPQAVSSKYRLVIEARPYGNGVEGKIKRGNDTVHGWGTSGVPTDLSRFLATHYYYESTPRYFETFLKLTNSTYPIVFIDAEGNESPLVYCGDESLRGGIAFDIRGEEIHISRTLDNGRPIPAGALLQGRLLFDPEAGTIHAISNRSAWKIWEAVIDVLDGVSCAFESDDEEINDPAITSQELLRLPHSVVTPISLFNAA
ncbi:MAG: hypothetical protein WC007_14405, partial [Pelobacteraceae bacterium]